MRAREWMHKPSTWEYQSDELEKFSQNKQTQRNAFVLCACTHMKKKS